MITVIFMNQERQGQEMIIEATKKVVENMDLTADEAAQVMDEMMSGEAEQINMASFLTALRMKGETVEEITAFAKGMRKIGRASCRERV